MRGDFLRIIREIADVTGDLVVAGEIGAVGFAARRYPIRW